MSALLAPVFRSENSQLADGLCGIDTFAASVGELFLLGRLVVFSIGLLSAKQNEIKRPSQENEQIQLTATAVWPEENQLIAPPPDPGSVNKFVNKKGGK